MSKTEDLNENVDHNALSPSVSPVANAKEPLTMTKIKVDEVFKGDKNTIESSTAYKNFMMCYTLIENIINISKGLKEEIKNAEKATDFLKNHINENNVFFIKISEKDSIEFDADNLLTIFGLRFFLFIKQYGVEGFKKEDDQKLKKALEELFNELVLLGEISLNLLKFLDFKDGSSVVPKKDARKGLVKQEKKDYSNIYIYLGVLAGGMVLGAIICGFVMKRRNK